MISGILIKRVNSPSANNIAPPSSAEVARTISRLDDLNDGDPAHLDTAVAALHARYLAAAQPEALD